ncbi:transcriptional antiterminator, BglG [Listeria newyorkensis]|uniref:Transcriptional antiterminator, BglG n=1 Tax=Listeria newyorkensis TaxID=1497681 RepID=A0ABX4XSI1_9LIST|nr:MULTISPECIES: PRD domain-containing protein [Listeria]KGL46286.1 transcriptional antiterminator, BglG [Listeriaceae bacterium FSL A5-0209]KGL43800.1 transcriptional antiterminator, BglG [Listeria newyorkensis]PNP95063.1 transcriptional antiterminator, BglG [Listeria newyorkensis]RQW65753.1 transcription antiterminator [Listeria sp. SHR_NRA_18]WAO21996.1 PRD domain-containing protein [Listeria newyorkensis]
MYLSARSRIILEKILSVPGDISIAQLASYLDVSERTVRRDLKEVGETLQDFKLTLVKHGSRLTVTGASAHRDRIQKNILELVNNEFTPFERQQIILRVLLNESEPVKLIALANELSVTVATVSSDLTRLEEDWNGKIHIKRKRGIGVELESSVLEKRELLGELLLMTVPKIKLYQMFSDLLDDNEAHIDERIADFVDLSLLHMCDPIITKWMKKLSYEISNDSYINLLTYLMITIQQIPKGKIIAKSDGNHVFLQEYPEYDIAERILRDCLPDMVEIPDSEIAELTMLVLESEIRRGQDVFYRNEKVQAIRIAKKLISRVAKEIDTPLSQITVLKGLTEHIQYSIIRLKKKMPMSNPLLEMIKAEFPDLFDIVHRAACDVYPFKQIPEEETGFIVLHFEAAIIHSENMRPYSALIVTSRSSGINTWLQARFRKRLPKLKKMKFITPIDLMKETNLEKYDMILSTSHLENFAHDYQFISIFFTDNEINAINKKLEKIANRKQNETFPMDAVATTDFETALSSLTVMQTYYHLIISLIKATHFTASSVMTRNLEDNLRGFSQEIAQKTNLAADDLYEQLNKHENHRKVLACGTNTAMFLINTEVETASVHVFSSKHNLEMHIASEGKVNITNILVFLLPETLSSEEIEIFTYLITMLTEDEIATSMIESGNPEKIKNLILSILQEFLEQKNINHLVTDRSLGF